MTMFYHTSLPYLPWCSGVGGARPVILRERENLQLTCATSGDPRPTVTWSRRDGWAVIDGPSKRGQFIVCR